MRRSWLLAPAVYAAGLAAACSHDGVSAIAIGMNVPQGLLDDATAVDLEVLPGAASCDEATGRTSGTFNEDDVVRFGLQKQGCAPGATWCRDITLDQDDEPRVFGVVASAAGQTIARGCSKVLINQDPVEVNITIRAEVEDTCCNDGIVQLGEQCDTADPAPTNCAGDPITQEVGSCGGILPDPVCECDCLARVIHVSAPADDPPIGPELKSQPAMAFAGSTGDQGGTLRAVFTDEAAIANSPPDINFRIFQGTLYPATDPFDQQLRLPMGTICEAANLKASSGRSLAQREPDIARVSNSSMFVVWTDDSAQIGSADIFGIGNGPNGCPQSNPNPDSPPVQINAAKGQALRSPAVAGGPSGSALVVWVDGSAVRARIYNLTSGSFTPEMSDIDVGTLLDGERPKVAGSPSGWVVTYPSPGNEGDVVYTPVSSSGIAGGEQRVNLATAGRQDQPDVAMLPDGRFALVWRSGQEVMFQRYGSEGNAFSGDQDAPLSVDSPPAERPRIAASVDVGNFYATIWATPSDGRVWSRTLDADEGSPFLRNHVTGQTSDFLVSHPAVQGQRSEPVVAVGPEFIAYGWVDTRQGTPSLYMRRFPHPPQ